MITEHKAEQIDFYYTVVKNSIASNLSKMENKISKELANRIIDETMNEVKAVFELTFGESCGEEED